MTGGEGGSKIVKNGVTSIMDDPLVIHLVKYLFYSRDGKVVTQELLLINPPLSCGTAATKFFGIRLRSSFEVRTSPNRVLQNELCFQVEIKTKKKLRKLVNVNKKYYSCFCYLQFSIICRLDILSICDERTSLYFFLIISLGGLFITKYYSLCVAK